ncbi:phage portal protein [Clostridium butyricum]|uniref:phage portal protein n=1 Tax=Clostridium butyricum TaxID=1492 RepID=UPI0013D6B59B|nr:phage portal protein [Clostridium butyricum]MCQ2016792.1 phage portal protein [Clostridium butyricum]MCQ2022601.1 phage portal protein [Clostridium butyricum]NFB69554.1 phage portal protein [Clostridium butyricum]NFB90391.1 phage portal protein [Clostridium butyricum]UTY54142.1 phage portal protein [Clostridium butyricum]
MDEEQLILINKCYDDYISKKSHYDEINKYYYGNTDTLRGFKPREGRSNLKVNTNFEQKMIDEESQYSFSNDITYSSSVGDKQCIEDIKYNLKNNKADHDNNLGTELVKMGVAYEINYYDKTYKTEYRFHNKIVSALDGYMYFEDDEPVYFLRMFKKQLDDNKDKVYVDVYSKEGIYHYDTTFSKELEPMTPNRLGIFPVGYGVVGGKMYSEERGYVEGDKTIHRTTKTLQDAFETNFSDAVCEISDLRNAILKIFGIEAKDKKDKDGNIIFGPDGEPLKQEPVVKDNCIMLFGDKTSQDAEWLIKNINDTFIKNTRDDIKELIYALNSHIDNNEKMQSNLSGIALRSRLQSLESKCGMNEKAMTNILKTRLECLFRFLYLTQSKEYDVNTIDIKFTPKVPTDITSIADMISKLVSSGVVSKETLRGLLPFIDNPVNEGKKVKQELKDELPLSNLDNINHDDPIGGSDES